MRHASDLQDAELLMLCLVLHHIVPYCHHCNGFLESSLALGGSWQHCAPLRPRPVGQRKLLLCKTFSHTLGRTMRVFALVLPT